MEKEKLINKWLDGSMTETELKAFKQLEEYEDYVKISETAKAFQAPIFDSEKIHRNIEDKLQRKETLNWRSFLKIAAVFLIVAAASWGISHEDGTSISTLAGNTETIVLPDNSVVKLNALSKLSYDKTNWNEKRSLTLAGEAFFKVEKGRKFKVKTSIGSVTVLGTQFSVKQRENYFEVKCFEGLVLVEVGNDSLKLSKGETFRVVNGKIETGTTTANEPSWIKGYSKFESVPFAEVLREMERQYSVSISIEKKGFNKQQLFTGSFAHDDLKQALKSVCIPLSLKPFIQGDQVKLK